MSKIELIDKNEKMVESVKNVNSYKKLSFWLALQNKMTLLKTYNPKF